ncbi:sushi, von Willebrand factor type A, EGF and pentraxin domain-containing protein 1 [Lingula anatina]|uniref:Sushi, von Willebrand factor type A, EGF and pentraxin domain-containing protein 1 n=1 Tax=Lingula anatina TaxID=7574 RepID=A0A2R2MRL4_LINAN|nr:sushi, von Willebrand factor type A, EGF and pentraxin domain-containing protein 1 [Lingula anatina]|eukprot:XP_023932783.1 sushi, von Willebrand factor type A, EGF and pentraxin domain-containing protein 1 [Lingula anatina]
MQRKMSVPKRQITCGTFLRFSKGHVVEVERKNSIFLPDYIEREIIFLIGGGYKHTFKIGETTVKYVFTDDNGNSANFNFKVEVRDVQPPTITCPKVDPVVSADREVDVFWVEPTVKDNSGRPVTVNSNMSPGKFYWGRYKIVYDVRDESGNRASCSFALNIGPHQCPDLHTPINGAAGCDTFGYGVFCTLQCQNPYDFDLPAGMTSVPSFYVCGGSGRWQPTTQVPDCTRYQDPNDNLVLTLYYDYECPDPRAQKQIKENAVSNFKASPFGLTCNCIVTVDNFRVICGAINASAVRGTPAPPRGKRSVGAPSLRGQNVELLMREMKNALEKSAQTIGLRARYNVHGEVESCPPGQEYKQERNKCAVCVKGYFQNAALKCEKCPKGQYSEDERQVMCVACPDGESTLTTGSFSRQNCTEMCRRGYYSGNGLEYPDSCSPCPADTYNTARGQMSCKPCPRNTHTAPLGGADDRRKCKGPCPAGTVSVDGLQPCKPCPKNTYQPNGRSTECQECPSGKVTLGEGKTRIGDCIDLNECLSNPCLNGARCEDRIDEYFCACPVGFTGKNCEVNIDDCESTPCMNGATCLDRVNGYSCRCAPGYTRADCSLNINECASSPCQNGATCVDKANGYTCLCVPGFHGNRCEINVDECADNPCENGGSCRDGVNEYTCQCRPGFTGLKCAQNIDDCEDVSCQNEGTCVDGVNSFQCRCPPGFTGRYCETNINECASSPCVNGATCHDDVNKFICKCKPYYSGKTCSTRESPCFGVDFNQASELDFIKLEPNMPFRSLSALTIEFWMESSDNNKVNGSYGTPISYGSRAGDNFTIFGYTNFAMVVNGEEAITGVDAADGQWHKICATWQASDGSWQFYKDGTLKHRGKDLSKGRPLPAGGIFVLGQKLNGLETFSPLDTFKGKLHGMRLWDRVLDCSADISDATISIAWPDFIGTIEGRLGKTRSIIPPGVSCST